MTKKHYDAIAGIITSWMYYSDETTSTCRAIAYDLADYFATENPKFQRDKFLTACGIETK